MLNYFDIETTGFDFKNDKIITIQYQELDSLGKPKGELIILKEWESDEKTIVTEIWNKLVNENVWSFITLGTNLVFDLTFLFEKFKKYNLSSPTLSDWMFKHPLLDIKSSLIIANNLQFKGSGLDKMTNKESNGKNIPIYYHDKLYGEIEAYIKQEASSFLEFFDELRNVLIKLKK